MPHLLRAALRPRLVRPALLIAAGAVAATTAFLVAPPRSGPVYQPIVVSIPHITVSPAPVVLPPAPPPPPAPAPPPEPARPVLRALAPTLDVACLLQIKGADEPTCTWDNGFPAISADGTLIAVEDSGPQTMADTPSGLSIQLIDTTTSRAVRELVIFTSDEAGQLNPSTPADPHVQRDRVLAKVEHHAAAAQRILDARHFRALQPIAAYTSDSTPGPIAAEIINTDVRIIDPHAATVRWRGTFSVESSPSSSEEYHECGDWHPSAPSLSWDPETRYVLGTQTARTGGCMCPTFVVETVRRIPPA